MIIVMITIKITITTSITTTFTHAVGVIGVFATVTGVITVGDQLSIIYALVIIEHRNIGRLDSVMFTVRHCISLSPGCCMRKMSKIRLHGYLTVCYEVLLDGFV